MSAVRKLHYKFRKYILHNQKVNPISDSISDRDRNNETSLPLSALRLRREQSKFTCYAEPKQGKGA